MYIGLLVLKTTFKNIPVISKLSDLIYLYEYQGTCERRDSDKLYSVTTHCIHL